MPSTHLILCHPHLLLLSIFPSISVFSNESALCIRWPKYRSFQFSLSLSNEYLPLIFCGMTDLVSLSTTRLSSVFSSTTIWKHQFWGTQSPLWSNSHVPTWLLLKTIALTIWTLYIFMIVCLQWFPYTKKDAFWDKKALKKKSRSVVSDSLRPHGL